MQTQRDHVHAYQTLVGRMTSALLLGDPNTSEPPARRAVMGIAFGVVLALLVGVGFWVYGLINPGGNMAWRQKGAILMEKESGARYVYRDGLLIPMRNHASAMLLQGQGSHTEAISRASLTELDRGVPIGIPDAPDSVPAPASLVTGSWLLCLPQAGFPAQPGTGLMSMNLSPEAESVPVGEDRYLWVAAASGEQYLVWRNQKLKLSDQSVSVALGLGTGAPPVAPAAWLSALPDGQAIGAAEISESGNTKIGGTAYPVGSLFKQSVGNGPEQFYVLRGDGLAPMSRTESMLLQAKTGRAVTAIDAASVAATPRSAKTSLLQRIPDLAASTPVPMGDKAYCLRQRTDQTQVISELVAAERRIAWIGMNESIGAYVKPSTGMIAASMPAPVEAGKKPDRFLITDRGMKYALTSDETIQALGFGGVAPRPMAAEVLALIPSGPALSRTAVGVIEKGRG